MCNFLRKEQAIVSVFEGKNSIEKKEERKGKHKAKKKKKNYLLLASLLTKQVDTVGRFK